MKTDLKDGYIMDATPVATKRHCQYLKIRAEFVEEYKYWHQNIWKEIPEGMKKAGILNMELFLSGDNAIMVLETPLDFDWDKSFGYLATLERQAEWEDFVSKFQMAESGQRSEEKWQLMERIFSLKELQK